MLEAQTTELMKQMDDPNLEAGGVVVAGEEATTLDQVQVFDHLTGLVNRAYNAGGILTWVTDQVTGDLAINWTRRSE